jgi:hypothetical protein
MNGELVAAIRALASSPATQKSKVGRIRELLTEIERAQRAGVRLADIAATLNTRGFEGMNLKCLQNLIYQARKEGNPATITRVRSTPPVIKEQRRTVITEGIHAESILEEARKVMKPKPATSTITLDMLRSKPTKSTT